MSESEVEAEVVEEEHLPAVIEPHDLPASATLFRTDDPAEIVKRATEISDVLAKVLRDKKLTKRIGQKEHVLVEGWTLCGSMLGVFAVPVWTHKLTDPEGWEARVEARTLAGQVIGAAEAQCTRLENMWSFNPVGRNGNRLEARDDFALRSMAQTRASAKALRLPLGFIIQLAGFEATPAEELSTDREAVQEARQEGPPPYPVPKNWAEIEKAVRSCDNKDEAWALFQAFLRASAYHLFGAEFTPDLIVADPSKDDAAKLKKDQWAILGQKAAGAAVALHDGGYAEVTGEFMFFTETAQRQAWASVMDGALLEIPDYSEPEAPPGAEYA